MRPTANSNGVASHTRIVEPSYEPRTDGAAATLG
jgi:hypothetical protein